MSADSKSNDIQRRRWVRGCRPPKAKVEVGLYEASSSSCLLLEERHRLYVVFPKLSFETYNNSVGQARLTLLTPLYR